jgi:hypothetical protein
MPTFADRGYRVVRAADPYGSSLGFLDLSHSYAHIGGKLEEKFHNFNFLSSLIILSLSGAFI